MARLLMLAILIALACASVAGAQVNARDLKPVEAGTADTSPLSGGLRHLDASLASPAFDQVYQVPGRDDLYMRVQGGVYAIFPRGVYAATPLGLVPQVPANTVFFIGMPDPTLLAMHFPTDGVSGVQPRGGAGSEALRIDTFVGEADAEDGTEPPHPTRTPVALPTLNTRLPRSRIGAMTPAIIESPRETEHGRIVYDEAYRRARIVELLEQAGGNVAGG